MRTFIATLSTLFLVTGCFEDRVDPPHYGVYSAFIFAAEVEGFFTPMDPGPSRVGLIRPFAAGPQLTPDFIDSPAPPFCLGFQFDATTPPNVVNADAGSLTIGGLNPVSYNDLTMGPMPGPEMPLPANIECSLTNVGATRPYACNVPSVVLISPPGSSWIDGRATDIAATGGEQLGAFAESNIEPPISTTATGSFDLFSIDPTGPIVAEWTETDGEWVMIELLGQLADGSVGAQVFCLADAAAGRHTIPAEAVALLPSQTPTLPLVIQTSLAALSTRRGALGWGGYVVGVGRGSFGITCLGPCM